MKILAFDLCAKELGFDGTYFSATNPKAAFMTSYIGNAYIYNDSELENKVKNIMEGCDLVCDTLWNSNMGTKIAYVSKDFILINMIVSTAKYQALQMDLNDTLTGREMLEGINYCMKIIDLEDFIKSRL